jgi:5-methylcytosine-specific restriction endonuclease McrA
LTDFFPHQEVPETPKSRRKKPVLEEVRPLKRRNRMRKLAHLKDEEIIANMTATRLSELENAADNLIYIDEVAFRKLHLKLGHSSIYTFLKEKFRYSKDETYPRVRAAECLRLDPELEIDLRHNRVNITYLMRAQIAFRKEDKRRKEAKLAKLSTAEKRKVLRDIVKNREDKRTIATAFPNIQKDYNEEKPVTADLTVYQFALNQEGSENLTRAKELASHIVPDGNLSELLNYLISDYVKRNDKRAKGPMPKKPTNNQRKYVSVETARNVKDEANHQCEYEHAGHRCTERFGLQRDHITPIAHGGTDDPENFRMLCRQHNRYVAEQAGLHRPMH